MKDKNQNNKLVPDQLVLEAVRSSKRLGKDDKQIFDELISSYQPEQVQNSLEALRYMNVTNNIGTENYSNNTDIVDFKTHISWKSVFVVGAVTALITIIVLLAMLSMGLWPLIYLVLIFQGLQNVAGFILVVAVLASGRILSKTTVSYPYLVSGFSIAFVAGVYLTISSFMPSSLFVMSSGVKEGFWYALLSNPIILAAIMIVLNAGMYVLMTFLTSRAKHPIPWVFLIGILAVALLSSVFFVDKENINNSYDFKVSKLEWAKLPTYLPPGVVDESKTPNNTWNCKDAFAKVTSYECEYGFKNYPGYLSLESQEVINTVRTRNQYEGYYAPKPFIRLVVFKDDPLLEKHKYKNGSCNVLSMQIIGTSSLQYRDKIANDMEMREIAVKPSCDKISTPGGKTLYLEAAVPVKASEIEEGRANVVNVPTDVYYEEDGMIVSASLETGLRADTVTSYYYSDKNFKTEFIKFIDSIK